MCGIFTPPPPIVASPLCVHGLSRLILTERGGELTHGQWAVVDALIEGADSERALLAVLRAGKYGLRKRVSAVLEAFDAVTIRELRMDLLNAVLGVGPFGGIATSPCATMLRCARRDDDAGGHR